MRSFPSFCATMMVPTFDELVTMSVTEYCSTGWGSFSENTASETLMVLPTVKRSAGSISSTMKPRIGAASARQT